jgi:hypothetical protein
MTSTDPPVKSEASSGTSNSPMSLTRSFLGENVKSPHRRKSVISANTVKDAASVSVTAQNGNDEQRTLSHDGRIHRIPGRLNRLLGEKKSIVNFCFETQNFVLFPFRVSRRSDSIAASLNVRIRIQMPSDRFNRVSELCQ